MNGTGLLRSAANIAIVIAIVYAVLLALLYLFQSRLLYFPELGRDSPTTPRAVGLAFDEVWLDVEPRVRLHAWYVPRSEPNGVVLILHGNAGSIALRVDWLRMFHQMGYASFVIDYRGYGRSSGT